MKKMCWVAMEYKKGWRVGLGVGNKPVKYIPYWFKNEKEIKQMLNMNIVYVHMDGGK